MDPRLAALFVILFLVGFAGLWLAITALLGVLAGWFALRRQFPAGPDDSRLSFRMRSGRMGVGVGMNNCLNLGAGPSGLRVSTWRMFAPLWHPFVVPWSQITAEPRTHFFIPRVRLSLGRPEVGSLTIDARLWQRLVAQSSIPAMASIVPPVSTGRSLYGVMLAWIATTAIASAFFFAASRLGGGQPIPLVICVAFPATVFGFAMFARFFWQNG